MFFSSLVYNQALNMIEPNISGSESANWGGRPLNVSLSNWLKSWTNDVLLSIPVLERYSNGDWLQGSLDWIERRIFFQNHPFRFSQFLDQRVWPLWFHWLPFRMVSTVKFLPSSRFWMVVLETSSDFANWP